MVADSDSARPPVVPEPHAVADLLTSLLALATQHHDPAAVCSGISAGATNLPGIGAAGILVRGPADAMFPVGTSAERPDLLELLEAGAVSAPAMACLTSGRPVAIEDIGLDTGPGVTSLAVTALPLGLRTAYVLPLSTGRARLGVLHLFGEAPVPDASLSVGRSLADVATLALIGADPDLDAALVTRRLHLAIEARVTIEQAKGVLAARFGITPELAFHRLAAASAATARPLSAVASAVVERTTDAPLDAALATRPPRN